MRKKHQSMDAVISIPPERAPAWRIAARVAGGLLLLLRLGLTVASLCGFRLLVDGMAQGTLLFLLDALVLLCAVFSLRFRQKRWYLLPGIAAAILLLVYGANVASYSRDRSYSSYSSPQGTHTLVMEADASMFSGRVRFYRRSNSLFLKDTGTEIKLDDGFQAFFKEHPPRVEWPEENVAHVTGQIGGQERVWVISFS